MSDIIQFSHANGFPAKSYSHFFEQLKPLEVNYVNQFGHAEFEVKNSWINLVDELVKNIEANANVPVVGVGHSFGAAVTLLAAQRRPELFKQLILMDPPLFLSYKKYFIGLAKALNIQGRLFPEARKTRVRKSQFTSKEEAYVYYQTKALFKDFHPNSFNDYIEHGIKASGDRFELAFSPKVEYQLFKGIPVGLPSNNLDVPSSLIYSNKFSVLEKVDLDAFQKTFPKMEMIEFDGGHLFPLEKPEETAALIIRLIK